MAIPPGTSSLNTPGPFTDALDKKVMHISVCVCTYKRSHLLERLLAGLKDQDTGGHFTYSIVIADNDELRSAEPEVRKFATASSIPVRYCVEPRQNIALARNKAVQNAEGDFIAFIDDDEFPSSNWLLMLFNTINEYGVDGVLGPVRRHFDQTPPTWLVKSELYQRKIEPTGTPVIWHEARTGNVLLRKQIFEGCEQPFRPEFRAGEDQDFYRRMIERGCVFIWSSEAVVHEVVPPLRWRRTYMLRKALLRGATAQLQPTCGAQSVVKSMIAVLVYLVVLPFTLLLGQHWFMPYSIKLFDHLGKLLAVVGVHPIKDPYVTE